MAFPLHGNRNFIKKIQHLEINLDLNQILYIVEMLWLIRFLLKRYSEMHTHSIGLWPVPIFVWLEKHFFPTIEHIKN